MDATSSNRPKPLFAVVNARQTFDSDNSKIRDKSFSPVLALPTYEPVVRTVFVSNGQTNTFYEVFYVFEDPRCSITIRAIDKQLREKQFFLASAQTFYENNPGPMPSKFHVDVGFTGLGRAFQRLTQHTERSGNPISSSKTNPIRPHMVPVPLNKPSSTSSDKQMSSVSTIATPETVHFALIAAMHLIRTEQLAEFERGTQRRFLSYIRDICPEHKSLFDAPAHDILRLESRMIRVDSNSFREAFFVRSVRSNSVSENQVAQISRALHSSSVRLKEKGIIFTSNPGEIPRTRYYVPPEALMRLVHRVPARPIPVKLLTHNTMYQATLSKSVATEEESRPSGIHGHVEVIELSSDEDEVPARRQLTHGNPVSQSRPNPVGKGSKNTPITLSDDDDSDVTESTPVKPVKGAGGDINVLMKSKDLVQALKPRMVSVDSASTPASRDMASMRRQSTVSGGSPDEPPSQPVSEGSHDTPMVEVPPEPSTLLLDMADPRKATVLSLEDASVDDPKEDVPNFNGAPADVEYDDIMDESVPASPSIGELSEPQTDVEIEPIGPGKAIFDYEEQCTDWATTMAASMKPAEAKRYLDQARQYPRDPIDTSFSDMMRDLPQSYLQATSNRHIFESWVLQNTSEEVDAPPIGVKNNVDEEPCPSWDFTYTNKLIYGDGVPKPLSPDEQEGCGCQGGCIPDPDKCACARRQKSYTGEWITPCFLYNLQGKYMPDEQHPIFECNDGCSCATYCNNRVVQNGRKHAIDIRKTVNRGWGVFAAESIPRGTYIGIYAGELLLDAEAEVRGLDLYNLYDRNYLFNVDFWYMKEAARREGKRKPKTSYVIDAMHAGSFTRYLNHSCDPNCHIIPCIFGGARSDMPYLAFFTRRDVQEDEEITFSYKGDTDELDEEEKAAAISRAEARRLLEKGRTKETATGSARFKIDVRCQCGSYNCNGSIWNWASDGGSDAGDDSNESE